MERLKRESPLSTFKRAEDTITASRHLGPLLKAETKKQQQKEREAYQLLEVDHKPYQILELKRDATPADVKKAYRTKARKFHGDMVETLHIDCIPDRKGLRG